MKGKKRNGRWRIHRDDLPLTAAQHQALQDKAEKVRQTVERVLPSRFAQSRGQKSKSLADLEAFRRGAELLGELRAAAGVEVLDAAVLERVQALLESALLSLAEGAQQYDRQLKIAAVNRTRADLAAMIAILLLEAGLDPPEPVLTWVGRLEREILPAVAGFARWADKLKGPRA